MYKNKKITLEDLKRGSDEVLSYVYKENRDKFINFARRYNLPYEDLVDVYQEAYIIFYNNVMNGKIKSFTSSISTYMISIGKHIILDILKKNKRILNPDFDLSIINSNDELIEFLDFEKEQLTTEQQLLYKYFAALGKKCQELLNLFYYRGFTIQDILEYTDYNSENVIKSTKSRCMKTLKAQILDK